VMGFWMSILRVLHGGYGLFLDILPKLHNFHNEIEDFPVPCAHQTSKWEPCVKARALSFTQPPFPISITAHKKYLKRAIRPALFTRVALLKGEGECA